MLNEGSILVLIEGYPQLLLGVHHPRAVPGNRFTDGSARNEQEPERLILGTDENMVTILIKDEGAIAVDALAVQVKVVPADHFMAEGIQIVLEISFPFDHIGKCGLTPLDGVGKA